LSALVKKDGKEDGSRAGLISKGIGLSYAEVVRSGSVPVVGGWKSRMRASLEEPCDLDLFPILRRDILEDSPTAVDCSLLESIPVDLPDLGKSLCPLGKQSSSGISARGKVASAKGFNLNSNLYTWKNMRNRFYLALGRVVGIFLGRGSRSILGLKHKGLLPMKRSFGSGLGRKRFGFRMACFLPKSSVPRPSCNKPVSTPEMSYEMFLVRSPSGSMEIASSDASEVAGSASPLFSVPASPSSIPVSSGLVTLLSTDPGAIFTDSMASSEAGRKLFPQVLDPVDLGRGSETSALGSQVPIVMGSPEGRILPSSSLEEPTSKPLIQYKRKGRKPKPVVGQGNHEDVGFLRRGFLESSSSSLSQADRSFSSAHPLNSAGGLQATSPLELSLACSIVFGDKGDRTMAFLSALDEDHRRWDMIEDCEL
jgi:hypothetical protein